MGETTTAANPFLSTEPFGPQAGDRDSTPPAAENPFMRSPLNTSYVKVPSNEHGAGIPRTEKADDLPFSDDYGMGHGIPQDVLNRVGNAAVEGYRNTPPLLTPEARAAVNDSGFLGQQIYNPILDAAGGALGGLVGASAGVGQSAYELGNAVSPRLGRDLHGLYEAAMTLLPTRAPVKLDTAPTVTQGPPRSVMERMAPPPIEGQTTLGRAIDLLRHDQQWNNPDAPGYHPPGFDPNQAFTPPGAVPPPSGPPMSGVPDTLLTRALGPDPNVAPGPPPAPPPPSFPRGTPATSVGAKQIASQYYAVADQNGGTLTPKFTDNWIDSIAKVAEQTEAGKAAAGTNPVADLVARLQTLRGQPLTLQAVQEVDQAIGKQISRQYGPGGSMQDAADLLDIQHKLRDQIDAAGEGDVTGGKAGFDALSPARKAWSQANKMDDLERMKERADQTANPTTSFRTQVTNYRLNRANSRGWSDDEIDALQDSANRGVVGGTLHLLGSRLIPYATAAAGSGGGITGAGLGWVVGQTSAAAARALANRMAAGRVANALNVLNQGVPPPPGQ